jgi:hypothetical protein
MWSIVEIIEIALHFWTAWRLFLSLFISIGFAFLVHATFPDQEWVYLISLPTMIAGFFLGLLWELKAKSS